MTTKIVEILAEILEGFHKNLTLEEMNTTLSVKKDIDQKTLSVAYSLVYDHLIPVRELWKKRGQKHNQVRILNSEEKEILGAESYNYLLYLLNVGLIDSETFESILEQVVIFPEHKLSREDINWMILISLLEIDSEILPGSRVLLYASDVIN